MQKHLHDILLQISRSPAVDNGEMTASNRVILDSITQGLAIDRASVWLLSTDKSQIDCTYLVDGKLHQATPNMTLARRDFPRYLAALDEERNIVANDAHTHPHTSEFSTGYLQPLGICSMLDTPIRHHGVMVGIICIEHRQAKQWQTDEIVFAGFLADIYGRALSASERMKYQFELEKLNSDLEHIIYERTQELTQSIEQLQQTQHRLIEVEKMASLGRLVAGIAHEINTPLGVAVTASSHAQATLTELEKLFESKQLTRQLFMQHGHIITNSIAMVNANLLRAVDLVNSFKQTAGARNDQKAEWLVLHQFIPQVLLSVQSLLQEHHVEIILNVPDELQVQSFSSPLAIILTRLIENACQHAFTTQSERKIEIRANQNTYNWQLEVADNGRGMSNDELALAFEPFFTTRRSQGAKGLGLTLVFNLVSHLLQGEISLRNSDTGCIISLTCPRQLITT
ncbi:ATP-binding protein [Rheinheimera baltica]|uniref:ATP-binding protein n=1 Tax=Rheinheimera baltica TaxID=67576 RepID=UPI00273EC0AD|nr:ATP-binding protein [Rheinheimera baltica]MDP5141923.1 ATP-binding protein [Rheinheimera baltica]